MMEHQLQNRKVAIINLGCKVNKYESDAMAKKLKDAGMLCVEPENVADVYIVNTCSVTNMAEKKSRQMLRRAKKQNPEAVIVATGCYVNAEHDALQQEPFVDVVVGNNSKKDIVEALMEYYEKKTVEGYYCDIAHTKEYEEMGCTDVDAMDHRRAYIKIQDGCNQFCSYCLIPYTRGRVRSRQPEAILSEIRELAMHGVKEFVLTGIHISSYGTDFDTMTMGLGELVKKIEEMDVVKRIRLGSLEPRIVTKEFLELVGRSEKLCPHFHLSLQSACNATLKRMNRKYTIEEFMDTCKLLREWFIHPAITTDVIVGFPGETEEEFETTFHNLEQLNLYEIHVFKYSVRSGTAAQKMPGQIPEEVKHERSERILLLTDEQKRVYENALSGYEEEVLVEEALTDLAKVKQLLPVKMLSVEQEDEASNPITKDRKKIRQYYTGHTRRYVKVCVQSEEDIVNRLVKVRL